jgi:hypothetical protein
MIFATTKQRILQYLDCKGIDKRGFFTQTGIKRGLLDADKLQSSVSDISIAKILATFPDINPDWLLTGQGSMLRETHLITPSTNLDRRGAPYYNVDFTGGFDLIFNDQSTLPAFYIYRLPLRIS